MKRLGEHAARLDAIRKTVGPPRGAPVMAKSIRAVMVEAADEAGVTIAHLTRAQTTRRVSEACHKGDGARLQHGPLQ
jgi:hypothetical protein